MTVSFLAGAIIALVVVLIVAFGIGVAFAVASMGDRAEQRVIAATAALAEMTAQRDYWRTRGEQLIDAGLARTGTIHQPTMEHRPPRNDLSSFAGLAAALSVTEIDSRKAG